MKWDYRVLIFYFLDKDKIKLYRGYEQFPGYYNVWTEPISGSIEVKRCEPMRECLQRFGKEGWELVATHPYYVPYGGTNNTFDYPTIIAFLKKPLD